MIIEHKPYFTEGLRVLQLTFRAKDGGENRSPIFRISKNSTSFYKMLNELNTLGYDYFHYEKAPFRVYASASQRDLYKAIKHFEVAQLQARHNGLEMGFYDHLQSRWISSLMQPTSVLSDDKWWLFDCDSQDEYEETQAELYYIKKSEKLGFDTYEYKTKNGHHILTTPFKRSLLKWPSDADTNPLMLWAYSE